MAPRTEMEIKYPAKRNITIRAPIPTLNNFSFLVLSKASLAPTYITPSKKIMTAREMKGARRVIEGNSAPNSL